VKPTRRRVFRVCLGLGALVLFVVLLTIVFGDALLNGYGKGKLERAFAETHPGFTLRIGKLEYAVAANRLAAQSVILSATNMTLEAGPVSLTGVRWARLIWGTPALDDVIAKASLDATNLDAVFPQSHYGIHCARLQASVPDSELIAKGTKLRALIGDEEFFAAHDFRTTRFHIVVPECRVLGLVFSEILQGKAYRAKSVQLLRPSFDALVNRDKPVDPFAQRPLMVHEALAAIQQPLQIDSLSITNGQVNYCERRTAAAAPGVLTFAAVNLSVESIANRGKATDTMRLRAQGDLMSAGTLTLQMTMPIKPPDFSFRYSGSLSAMDLTRLDAFLDVAELTRIKSGIAQEVAFDINVTAGEARGRVRAIYRDLVIALLDKEDGTENGLGNRVASLLTNALKIENSNAPDAAGLTKEGKVNYTRNPDDEFLQFAWFALRSGVLDAINQ
jgi:hypothetical protein